MRTVADDPEYAAGERVQVRTLSGWKPGTVVTRDRRTRLYHVLTEGELVPHTRLPGQLRPAPEPEPCASCAQLEALLRDARTELDIARRELRAWINVG